MAAIVETAKFPREDIGAAAGEFEDVIELARPEIRIDLVGDRADQLERKERDRKLDAVRQLYGDDVAALDADAAIELGAAQNLVLERAIADAPRCDRRTTSRSGCAAARCSMNSKKVLLVHSPAAV